MEVTTAPITNKNTLIMRTTALVATITKAIAKKTTSTARLGRLHLLSEIAW